VVWRFFALDMGAAVGRASLEPGMNSFEMNKIAGAILFTLTLTLGLGILAEIMFSHHALEKPGYDLPDAAPVAEAGGAAPAAQEEPLGVLLAKASVEKGQVQFKKCAACHTIDKGGKNGTGPNLYGVLGGPMAHKEDFAYSEAMKERHAKGDTWTPENFIHFIAAPAAFIKGTKMSFAGLPKAPDRADLLAYVHSLADNPIPLPTADAAPAAPVAPAAAAPAAPADGNTPAAESQPKP
jgi:cytochrome c